MSRVQMEGPLPQIPFPPRRRRLRWWMGIPVALVLLLAGLYGFILYETDLDLREAMAEADRDCPGGWQIEDLEAGREEIPDEENAALVAMKVKSLLPENWPMPPLSFDPAEAEDRENTPEDELGSAWFVKLYYLPPQV